MTPEDNTFTGDTEFTGNTGVAGAFNEVPAPGSGHVSEESVAGNATADNAAEVSGSDSPVADSGAADAPVVEGNDSGDDLDMSAFEEQLEDSELATALTRNAELEDQLARANASLYNLDQEYAGYVRRSKENAATFREGGRADVLDALIPVLDDIYAARNAGDLVDGPFASIAAKLEETLQSRFELTRFGEVGEEFDPQVHEALMANTNPEVETPVIAQVLQPGYRRGDKVLRAVKVIVDNPQ